MHTSFENEGEIRIFSDIKVKGIHHNSACITRNVKGLSSGRKKMIPVESIDLYKGMKSTGSTGYMDQYTMVLGFCVII